MSKNPGKSKLLEEKSTVELTLADPLGRGISGLRYQIRQGAKVIAKGLTDANGRIASFVSSIEELTVDVERFASTEMKAIKTFIPSHENFSAKLLSGKVKEVVQAQPASGAPGTYRRKTYRVQEGDTLGKIAVREGTTVEVLVRLNNIKNPDKIAKGAILKLPTDAERKAGSAATQPSHTADPASTAKTSHQVPVTAEVAPQAAKSSEVAQRSDNIEVQRHAEPARPNVAHAPAPAAKPAPAPQPAPAPKPAPAPVPKPASAPPSAPTSGIASALARAFDVIFVEKTEARGANGSPKTPLELKCDQSSCIKLGATGPLVEELNIRLMGFGGSVRSNTSLKQFTADTEAAVKQFQRDYMGAPETGVVCGAVLKALDDFRLKFPLPVRVESLACPCGKCGGWGKQRTNSKSVEVKNKHGQYVAGVEYPGMNRALLWLFRASLFYVAVKDKKLGYSLIKVSSGYRCWDRNKQKKRTSFNHMGNALDIQFKHGNSDASVFGPKLATLRDEIFVKRIGAQIHWTKKNVPALETEAQGLYDWVHIDIREYGNELLQDRYYTTTQAGAEGEPMLHLAKAAGLLKLVNCGGIPAPAPAPVETSGRKPVKSLELSPKGVDFIKDWEHFRAQPYDDTNGYCTIGFGHLIGKGRCATMASDPKHVYHTFPNPMSREQADRQLRKDIADAVKDVKTRVQSPLFQYEFDALVSLAYNTGGLRKFVKLLANVNMKNYSGCCAEFEDITNGGVTGLVKRRKSEMKMFRTNVYDSKH